MVWDTAQSAQSTLYTLGGAVERHNNGFAEEPEPKRRAVPDEPESAAGSPPPARSEAERENSYIPPQRAEPPEPPCCPPPRECPEPPPAPCPAETERPCGRCAEAPREAPRPPQTCADCPRHCPRCGRPLPAPKSTGPLDALLADKDTLLLAVLILLLWHEKADMKLIGALAFILLGN